MVYRTCDVFILHLLVNILDGSAQELLRIVTPQYSAPDAKGSDHMLQECLTDVSGRFVLERNCPAPTTEKTNNRQQVDAVGDGVTATLNRVKL